MVAPGHTPLSKAAYAGKVQACEFFLGMLLSSASAAPDAAAAAVAVEEVHGDGTTATLCDDASGSGSGSGSSASGSSGSGSNAGVVGQGRCFARLRVPVCDLLLPDGNGFRPADIARCAGFEGLAVRLSKLADEAEAARHSSDSSERD